MYGDTEVLRRRAAQLREQAVDVRGLADQLVARTEILGWHGRAADAMRERVTERAGHLRAAAAEHDRAADSLDRHLREVERLQEAITTVETKAGRLVADARTRAARQESAAGADPAPRRTPDPGDRVLLDFEPPPPGHRDWLTVSLPGL